MPLLDSSAKINEILDKWKEANRTQQSPIEVLDDISSLLETEAAALDLLDPDPFDERQSVRDEPDCVIGHLLKVLTDNEEFMEKATNSYMFNSQNDFDLNCAVARLFINMMPSLQHSDIFLDVESNVNKLLQWAKEGKEPLRSYACALLVPAMKIPECPGMFMTQNAELVPMLIKRLQCLSKFPDLKAPSIENFENCTDILPQSSKKAEVVKCKSDQLKTPTSSRKRKYNSANPKPSKQYQYNKPIMYNKPLTIGKQQDLILRYLHPISEYQELLAMAFELNVMDLLFYYIDPKRQNDPQLACSALLYLASLLCHKKFIVEFVNHNGIQKILDIPQPSSVATMSSLCLYYMVYNEGNEDCVERICLLPQVTLQRLVEYLLWQLECSHISGRCHSSLFFSMTFSFKAILQLFDSMDGLRKVINLISTLKIMRVNESDLSTDDDVYLDREIAKNACLTLKRYFEAHLTMISDDYKNSCSRHLSNEVPVYKPMIISPETIAESMECIIRYDGEGGGSIPEKQLIKRIISLGIPQLLLQLVSMAAEWKNYNNRVDVLVTTLEILLPISAFKKIALAFCQQVPISPNESNPGIKVLLRAVEGDLLSDIQVQKSALKVICSCVTSKALLHESKMESFNHRIMSKEQAKSTNSVKVPLIQKVWSVVRINNGIMILLALLKIKTPMTEADSVRALVCKALYGLSENELICQVLGKLPMFHNDQLQILMREPVLSDRINEHVRFCKYASLLMERVTGKPSKTDFSDTSPMLSRLTKAGIISQTKITYPQKELLMIVYNHLTEQGLEKAAQALKLEANLPTEEKPLREPGTPYLALSRETSRDYPSDGKLPINNACATPANFLSKKDVNVNSMTPFPNRRLSVPANATTPFSSPQTERRLLFTPKRKILSAVSSPIVTTPSSSQSPSLPGTMATRDKSRMEEKLKKLHKQRSFTPPPPSLDRIVTGYLRDQHAKCANPVATCPPFSLLRPHHCPEPMYRRNASLNITKRLYDRQMRPPYGGRCGRKQNRGFVYSKFRSGMVYKSSDEDDCVYTSCAWVSDTGSLALGTQNGDVKIINYMGQDELFHHAHERTISSLDISNNCKLIATSAAYGQPSGAVWSVVDSQVEQALALELKFEMAEDLFVKFNNNQDRVIGTDDVTANIYDLTTGQLVSTFYDQNNANDYSKNVACFGPSDDLLLNDGCLWDVRAKRLIHKFDKFNENVSGVFHPSGLEIIINAEVWDVRTFHLLDTCPALENCQITFSNLGDVMYAAKHKAKDDFISDGMLGPFESSFRTFDAYDYTAIGTVDVKKTILDICPDPFDQCLAVIEDGGSLSHIEYDTSCRLYNIGRTKRYGEEESDEEQDDDTENPSSSVGNRDNDSNVDLMNFLQMIGNDEGDDEDDDDDDDEDDNDDNDSSNNDDDFGDIASLELTDSDSDDDF